MLTQFKLGAIAMAKRNRMNPHLYLGDQFQFAPDRASASGAPPNFEKITYQGTGATYTVTAISNVSEGYYDVTFTPAISALPSAPYFNLMCVQSNLNKVFVRAYLQVQTANASTLLNASDFDMYYFRRIRNSDAGSGYGINTYDASGNLTFTSNARPFELAALGVTTKYDSVGITDPKTGDWYSQPFMFGSTPTNYAIYTPMMGYCIVNWTSSQTKGTGTLTARNDAFATPGWAAWTGVSARTTPGATDFTICKATPHIMGASQWPGDIANELHVYPNSYVMVIDTDKYQP